jgi:hypothetical protein
LGIVPHEEDDICRSGCSTLAKNQSINHRGSEYDVNINNLAGFCRSFGVALPAGRPTDRPTGPWRRSQKGRETVGGGLAKDKKVHEHLRAFLVPRN